MSAYLAEPISRAYISPSSKAEFFRTDASRIDEYLQRELPTTPLSPCDTNLFFGFFFGGTGNNYEDSLNRKDNSQSNVARLYSAYPGLRVPGELMDRQPRFAGPRSLPWLCLPSASP